MDIRMKISINLLWIWIIFLLLRSNKACVFHTQNGLKTEAEGVRFIRVREDLQPGKEILYLHAYPRTSLVIRGMERSNDHKYFKVNEVNSTTVQILLSKSLDDLVDRDIPQNLLKFRILCADNEEMAYMSVTVYIEDINDHTPNFLKNPYLIEVDESTPPGTTIFQEIAAFDRDKPNTPNSDVHITFGQSDQLSGGPFFALESPHRPYVILKRSLDFDHGIREFSIPLIASDRGSPIRTTNTTLRIVVKDHDDLPPKFTEGVYRTKINEFFPMTGKTFEIPLHFVPPIEAFDQDSLNATLIYDIISGNERKLFKVNEDNGVIILEKEIDLEEESLPGNTFVLQVEARQRDSPIKRALARVEIEILDLNDNAPEFEVDLYNISIVENLPSGFSVLQVNAIDRDQGENAEFYYNVSSENPSGAFLIDARTGWITVRDHTLLDREVRSSIAMTVQAVERVPAYDEREIDSGTVQVEITLLDSNDNTPQFENGNLYEFKVNVNAIVGSVIGKVSATDPDQGRNGMILYELQRPKGSGYVPFRLDSQTGTMFVSGQLRKGRIALFVEASDQPTNPSERRFSLAVVTIEVHSTVTDDTVDFVGAPYEFWVGADVPVGTSVGQVRTTLDYDGSGEIMYDLLHSYPEGVPFAIEERSGIVTVIRNLEDFDRMIYYFEAVANVDQQINTSKPRSRLIRRTSRSEKQVTKNGEIIEIDEGVISDTENILVTNVTVHVVSPNDDRGILMRGTNLNPIEFHIKENLPGAIIGRLVYKNGTKGSDDSVDFTDIVGQAPKVEYSRQDRNSNSLFRRNSSQANFSSAKRSRRGIGEEVIPSETIQAMEATEPQIGGTGQTRSFSTYTSKRVTTWKPKLASRRTTPFDTESLTPIPVSVNSNQNIFRTTQKNLTSQSQELVEHGRLDKPIGLRFLIANQPDVSNKITITEDGTLMTLSGLDREVRDIYRLTVIAEYSKGFTSGAGIYQVNVHVDDVNDNAPVFDHPVYSGIIYENSPVGTDVILNKMIRVTDSDAGRNSEFTLSLSGVGSQMFKLEFVNATLASNSSSSSLPFPEAQERFDIEKSFLTMQLILLNPNQTQTRGPHYILRYVGTHVLDRERESFYRLNVVAVDSGGLSSSVALNILIADVNDNAPVFDKIAVFKNAGVEVLEYTDELEIYFIERMPKRPSTVSPDKMTSLGEYAIEGSPRMSNETRTQRARRGGYQNTRTLQSRKIKSNPLFSILESVAVGTPIISVTATDEDSEKNAQVFYKITSEQVLPSNNFRFKINDITYFSIDRLSGEIRVSHPLQAETEVILNLTAHDIGDLSDSTTIRFKVVDINDHPPVFKKSWYSFDLEEGIYYDQTIDRIETTDDDYGQNANITYRIASSDVVPFHIVSKNGALRVNGDLDREYKSEYLFHIVATDNSLTEPQLSSSVEVEINILDLNDNAPEFIGYDDMVLAEPPSNGVETGRKLISDENMSKIQQMTALPVYKAYLNRNTAPGTFVKQITAIDKDYAGNGNGLVMFSLLHHKMPHLFEIDSRDGVISTISRFSRYNGYEHVNLSIVASDLGSPSKSSTAMLLVNLQGDDVFDDEETNLFTHKYYELEVEENNNYPLPLIKVNVSALYVKDLFKWSIIPEYDENGLEAFIIDPKNGTLVVIQSLDREMKDQYRLKIRADHIGRESRTLPTLTYPVGGDRVHGLQENEVRVVVRVSDVNDNAPKFKGNGRPIVTIIPNTANFGYPVTQVEAIDRDVGANAEVRYKLLNEPSRLFGIDEDSGKIRILGPVRGDQRVYGFDVKATDRKGEDDGKSSIANVFVYVLDENRQVRLVISGKPVDVEREADILMDTLSEATGMDVRIRLLEPHIGGSEPATDVYVYAIDPKSNSIVDMEDLQTAMSLIDMKSLTLSPSAHVLELSELGKYRSRSGHKSTLSAMSGAELASIILAIVVFAGGLATSLCVICIRFKRRQILPPSDTGLPYSVARVPSMMGTGHSKTTVSTSTNSPESKRSLDDIARLSTTFSPLKSSKGVLGSYDERPREYIDVPLPKSVLSSNLNLVEHDSACLRFNQIHGNNMNQPQDTSMQSHNSSGHDSGVGFIARDRSETPQENLIRILQHRQSIGAEQCTCGRIDSNACCTGDSSDSYEDSLKNEGTHKKSTPPGRNHGFRRSLRNSRPRQGARHSFSGVRDDLIQQSPRIISRPRGRSFHYSVTDLEERLHNLEQSFREPFRLKTNSRC